MILAGDESGDEAERDQEACAHDDSSAKATMEYVETNTGRGYPGLREYKERLLARN